jgi:hypothetical protein
VFRYLKRRENSRPQPSVNDPNLLVHTIITVVLLAAFTVLAVAFLSAGPAPGSTRARHINTQKHSVTAA